MSRAKRRPATKRTRERARPQTPPKTTAKLGRSTRRARNLSAPARPATTVRPPRRPGAEHPERWPKTVAQRERQAAVVLERLGHEYPDAHCALDYRTPLQLLIATILSAQCTDKRVNMVTPQLFATYPTVESLAAAKQEDLEEIIKSTGFFRSKAKSIIAMANALVDLHGGEVPSTMEQLVDLPGVGRKTANVVLGNAFDRNEGIVVDTHVTRLSQRLGFTREADAVRIEQALMPLFPRQQWAFLAHLLIEHGRRICEARAPRCGECVLNDVCPSCEEVLGARC